MQSNLGPLRDERGGPSSFSGKRIAGVELGGTKCICSLASPAGETIDQSVIPTGSPDETLGAIEEVLRRWQSAGGIEALGIASFGPVDLDPSSATYGFITTAPKPGWQQIDVAGRLGRAVGLTPAFDTDVNGAAMAEIEWGAGQGLADFAYITVGTGVGVGLIVNGQATRGFAHCELGHIRVARLPGDDWPGACPYHGDCVEGLVAGGSLKARLASDQISDLGPDHPLWQMVAGTLAQLCHVIVCTSAPHRIAVGGGVIEGQPHLLPRIDAMLRESIAGYMPIPEGEAYVGPPALGARAGQLGPIALALRQA